MIADYLTDFRSSFGPMDCWRKVHPRSRELTWFNSDFSISSRLDKFLSLKVYEVICFHLQFRRVVYPIMISLIYISSRISELAEAIDSFDDVRKWWDFCKDSLKAEIVAFSKEERIRASHSRVDLTNRLIPLKQRLASVYNSVKAEIASLELELKLLVSAELEVSKIRFRSHWLERGEKPTRFFFQLERERSSRSSVSSNIEF